MANRASWEPGVGLTRRTMSRTGTTSGSLPNGVYSVSATSAAELAAPVELEVLAWKKGSRSGGVVKGAGGPGGDSIRTSGRVPWGAEVEFAYTTGYDSQGRVSVHHVVDERGYGVMLSKPDSGGNNTRAA